MAKGGNMKIRCPWVGNDLLMIDYHDKEWGSPVHEDRLLFEFLILESAQAGLSWITVLKKRDNYRAAFNNFDPPKIAQYDEKKIEELMDNKGIIRNRRKILATISNAKAVLTIQKEFGSFDDYIWQFTQGKPIQNKWKTLEEIPSFTEESKQMSNDLKNKGFKFVGPTICYAFMQAVGMVNDHITKCYRYSAYKWL
jgi:DNA-3-methyladenine glycosylase I